MKLKYYEKYDDFIKDFIFLMDNGNDMIKIIEEMKNKNKSYDEIKRQFNYFDILTLNRIVNYLRINFYDIIAYGLDYIIIKLLVDYNKFKIDENNTMLFEFGYYDYTFNKKVINKIEKKIKHFYTL